VELAADSLPFGVARYLAGADVLCLDAQYTLDEYEGRAGIPKKGWGHSTAVEAAKVARLVDAKRLLLFHHDPSHSDSKVDRMTEEARDFFPISEAAHEGQRLFLGPGSPFGYSLAASRPSKQVPTQPWWQEPAPH
jgi:ribonuclease BN (tRNA processing enzyme)